MATAAGNTLLLVTMAISDCAQPRPVAAVGYQLSETAVDNVALVSSDKK